MLTILGGLAEFKRELILPRTGNGRTRAKACGVRFGRPPALNTHQRTAADMVEADARQRDGCAPNSINRRSIARRRGPASARESPAESTLLGIWRPARAAQFGNRNYCIAALQRGQFSVRWASNRRGIARVRS